MSLRVLMSPQISIGSHRNKSEPEGYESHRKSAEKLSSGYGFA